MVAEASAIMDLPTIMGRPRKHAATRPPHGGGGTEAHGNNDRRWRRVGLPRPLRRTRTRSVAAAAL